MPSTLKSGAVVFAKDIKRVATFYERLLSMPLTHADHEHIVLESEAVQLVIHAIPEHIADSIHISSPPDVRDATPIKLMFAVVSLAEARMTAPLLGGHVGDKQREWEFRGARVCDGYDPEGNVFQLRQNVF